LKQHRHGLFFRKMSNVTFTSCFIFCEAMLMAFILFKVSFRVERVFL